MPTVATIGTRFTGDNVDFIRKIEEAERRAATFGGRIQSTFEGAFKRTPGRRAERAIGNLLGDLSTGNAAQGLAMFASRLTGLGLAAGIGIGAAVEIFKTARQSIKETDEAVKELQKTLSIPAPKFSAEGIQAAQSEIEKKADDLKNKTTGWWATFVSALPGSGGAGQNLGHSAARSEFLAAQQAGQAGPDDTATAALKAQEKARKRDLELGENLAKLELRIANNKRIGAEVSEREGALLAIRLGTEEKIEKIGKESRLQGVADVGRVKAALEEKKISEKLINKRADAKDREYELQLKIARLQGPHEGLTPENQKLGVAGLELQDLTERVKNASPDEKMGLEIERIRKENEVKNLLPPKFAAGTIAARNAEDAQGGYGTLAGRANEMNDPSAYGSLAYNAVQRGENPVPKGDISSQEVLAEVKGFNARMDKYWGTAK